MVPSYLRLIAMVGILALSACAVTPLAPQKDYAPVAIPDSSPAHSLLESARSARSRGDTGAAGRYLERALGMAGAGEATVLYRELADLRLTEDKPRDAEGLTLRALRVLGEADGPDAEVWRFSDQLHDPDSGVSYSAPVPRSLYSSSPLTCARVVRACRSSAMG